MYAQNAYDLMMLGGYAEKGIANRHTGEKVYSNLATVSVWADIQSNWGKLRGGLFAGLTKNLGSQRSIEGNLYSGGSDVRRIFRIAPRVFYLTGPSSITLEGEYTGTDNGIADRNGGVTAR